MRTKATRWRTLSQLHELNFLLVLTLSPSPLPLSNPKKTKQTAEKKKKLSAKAVRLFVLLISCAFLPCLAASIWFKNMYFFLFVRSFIVRFGRLCSLNFHWLCIVVAAGCHKLYQFRLAVVVRLPFTLRSIPFISLGTKIMPNQKWFTVADDYLFINIFFFLSFSSHAHRARPASIQLLYCKTLHSLICTLWSNSSITVKSTYTNDRWAPSWKRPKYFEYPDSLNNKLRKLIM